MPRDYLDDLYGSHFPRQYIWGSALAVRIRQAVNVESGASQKTDICHFCQPADLSVIEVKTSSLLKSSLNIQRLYEGYVLSHSNALGVRHACW